MPSAIPLMLALLATISSLACAQEIAYTYGESGGRPLESGNITEYNGTDMVTSSIAGGGSALRGTGMTVEEMKNEIALKLNVPNQVVDDKAGSLVLDYPGDRTIDQICSIYEHMVGKWSYKSDTRGIEVFQYSNQSLEKGGGRFSGQGDCDDFAILLASLVESVGGTSRIVLAYGPKGGHAYTEVYLGKAGSRESDVQRMLSWLRKNYKVKDINTHKDLKNDDVWLNLDWWKDPNTGRDLAKHPGGPFFSAASQVPIPTREGIPPQPLKPVNEPPEVLFTISPEMPVVGWNASFNASQSRDIGGRIEAYEWDFGDGNKSGKMRLPITSHIYSKGGPRTVILTLEDDEGAANSSFRSIIVNNPPQANFTPNPPNPKVGDQVKFDASESYDSEDGKSLQYYWEINNGSVIFRAVSPPKLPFDEPGMYWINLTVTDKNSAEGHKNILLKINQPPIPRIGFDNTSLDLGEIIEFSAAASEDLDGKIVGYTWDFGDDSEVDRNKTALHIYDKGGEKTVRLTVEDNEGAMSDISQEIFINKPPIASFSVDPVEPKKGEPVSFNASASSDPDGKIERYLWDFGIGKSELEVYYLEFAEHIYNRLQKYNVTLTVVDDKDATGSFSQFVEVKDLNSKPILVNLQPDIKSPQEIGSAVTWTAVAFDEESDQLEFRFSLDRATVQDWSHNSSWYWIADKAGTHVIEAKVRDGKTDLDGDSSRSVAFEIIVPPRNYAPVLTDLSPDKLSPQKAGSVVSWTAKASDSENDPIEFQFSLDGNVVQDWSESPTWIWTAHQVRTHSIEVIARDAEHLEGTVSQSASFEIVSQPNQAPALTSLLPDKESPQESGTVVTWTAMANDAESDPIEFQYLLDGIVVQDWSASSFWSWTADQVGIHTVEVKARDGLHEGAQEDGVILSRMFSVIAPQEETTQIRVNRIANVRFAPVTPANLVFGEPVKVSFDYEKNQTGPVMIFADFMIGGSTVGYPFDYYTDGSPDYSDAMGTGDFDLSIDSNKIVAIDGVRVIMTDKDYKNLCEIITPVQFNYGPNNISSELKSICAMGNTHFIQNNYKEAIADFDKAIQIAPGSKYAWKDRGDAFSAIADYKKAIESYDEALKIEPRFAEAWRDKGEALFLSGKYEEAVGCFDEAITSYLGRSVYNDGNLDGARDGKAKALNAMGRNFISKDLDVIDTGLVTLTRNTDDIFGGDKSSYNFFEIPGQPAKTYGGVDYGDFYFVDNKFFANNAGMQGLVDLGPVEFNINAIKIPIEGFYNYGLEAIIEHVYVSPARWCTIWENGNFSLSECGQDGKYIIFKVDDIKNESEAESVDIVYMLAIALNSIQLSDYLI